MRKHESRGFNVICSSDTVWLNLQSDTVRLLVSDGTRQAEDAGRWIEGEQALVVTGNDAVRHSEVSVGVSGLNNMMSQLCQYWRQRRGLNNMTSQRGQYRRQWPKQHDVTARSVSASVTKTT